jgi:hypothetical protein
MIILLGTNQRYGNGKWKPADGTDEQLQYTYWLHTAEGKRILFCAAAFIKA